MSWKKYFRTVPTTPQSGSTSSRDVVPARQEGGAQGTTSKFASYLPEVYAGHPNRIQRYYQYDDMDRDSDVNAAIDTIADFCTQSEEQTENPFTINYLAEANETEVKLLKTMMTNWVKLNDFKSKLWYIFRNTIKYGDAFFLRDPETGEWLWMDQFSVMSVNVDELNGKTPEAYVVRGLDYNKQAKFATKGDTQNMLTVGPLTGQQSYSARPLGAGSASGNFSMVGSHIDQRTNKPGQGQGSQQDVFVVEAEHVIHLSLSVGMDINWPFGASVLEPIFKTFKQKELLEDAILIYRVQRAPERRIFYIDVGQMPAQRAKEHIQGIKNEIHQRRIPNRTGGGASIMDAAYNPLSMIEDYFFAQSSEGRGSRVETLAGGDNLGEIGDLDYFNKKLARGMRIPPSYISMGEEGQGATYNDGKVGTAMIQEFRFNKYCLRLQSLLAPIFDEEFKNFVRQSGVSVDSSIFELQFNPPQNFTKYRQIELDTQQIGVYSQIADNARLSERFKLKRFLNLTDEELLENERLWAEENAAKLKKATGGTPAEQAPDADLSSVGIRSGGGMDDFGMDDPMSDPMEGDMGDAAAGTAPPVGGAPAGGAPAGGPAPAAGGAPF